ncbi:uncharacterized protein CC84DRAFT_1168635 [Paraphaeosphaeria sporulosa]|uniref:Uncharacterized protein n=1 Tax=Paraphaeosphaeria sporulosa TaxID=1460663 RepID=A0A177C126_9PLEO|nr:uncharacterized protein CC84DRAFT_1168635 [Paraphaeosphaeria sporulosa]OAG00542.1 hypothetical protein CC84DRAFT_1168635 [Paraphaeosphaeria sporulosa]
MSNSLLTMDNGYYCYDQQLPMAPEVPVAPELYSNYEQYAAQRSKTPTSLVNHTGLSPGGPLSTPPMSRNPSRGPDPPPGQYPEPMLYGDSPSDSPTSVKTPDNDSVEEFTLDTHLEAYQANGNMMTTQVSPGPLTAHDQNMFFTPQGTFTGQALTEPLNTTLAAHQPQHLHPQPFNAQARLQPSILVPQHYNNYQGQPFANQAAPWTSEQPMRSPDEPGSSVVLFDPITDFIDYSRFTSPDVGLWAMNETDPTYLASPNEPLVSPQDPYSMATQSLAQQQPSQPVTQSQVHANTYYSNSSPVDMWSFRASPSPSSRRYAPYEAKPVLQMGYMGSRRSSHQHPSPIATSIELPSRINLQSPSSAYASVSSPGGSEGMFSSYQQSDLDAERRESQSHQSFGQTIPPPSIVDDFSPDRTLSEAVTGLSPDPEGPKARRQVGPIRNTGRPGGRALGTHLEPKVAKAAHDMRKIVACWHCVLQRDKCGPGDICERCVKRAQRPNADCGLGCSRIKLIELSEYFLPMLVMQIHEDSHLTHFVTQFIHQWGNQEINVYMTCEQRTMPRMQVKVYEFQPRGEELLVQLQYQTNPQTQERYTIRKRSPALGMVHINHNEEKKYDKYLNDIVDNHLDAFGDICWAEDDNDFSPRLFKLMTRVKPKSEDEAKLLREVFRLIVCTYIMSHTITMAEETKNQTLSKMHSYTDPSAYVQNYTSPRMTARQLKYFFARLQRSTLAAVLNKLQQIFKSSRGCDKWLAAFVAVVGMAMAAEDQQKTTHQVMDTRAVTERLDPRDAQAQADIANRDVDQRMNFVSQIFRWKYNRKCNPLRDCEQDWEKEAGFGDETSVTFVRSVAQLVKENIDYLQQRQGISVSHANQGKYTARLVAPFLLSFWLPQ